MGTEEQKGKAEMILELRHSCAMRVQLLKSLLEHEEALLRWCDGQMA
jgi:hypothetical protein